MAVLKAEIEVLKRENELLMAHRKENEENEFKYGNDTGSADWAQRLQIAVDVVKGLEHLHSKCEHRIVHRDIKSENILLDGNLVAKVADFGICEFLPEDVSCVMTRVMGSFGYLDPEYDLLSQLYDSSQ
ncbi:Receptor-like protein kinase THESEUS 1 [Acorus calamus]|uniref:non-specific serine/threonine protein kinase n=1 Tax=Acorus calamus TaxID=4465 RepID=A0AAV9EPC9_ACOCL|nr:Receptor-like protein kinase THESEUS 1 [Acorus calamus]